VKKVVKLLKDTLINSQHSSWLVVI